MQTLICGPNAICANTVGSYTCTCTDGYTTTPVNECDIGTHTCDVNAICTHSGSSYTCECLNGYFGNGEHCVAADTNFIVETSVQLDTTVPYSDSLSDKSSEDYASYSAQALEMFTPMTNGVTANTDVTLDSIDITFISSGEERRQRSITAAVIIDIIFNFAANTIYTNAVDAVFTQAVKTEANNVVSKSDNTLISNEAVATVSAEAVFATSTVPTDICEYGWSKVSGQCVRVSQSPGSWYDAKTACESTNAHLAIIKDSVANTILGHQASLNPAWIGATDEAVEGTWMDPLGQPVTYTNWRHLTYESYNADDQDCAFINGYSPTSTFTWRDIQCGGVIGQYICQKSTYSYKR